MKLLNLHHTLAALALALSLGHAPSLAFADDGEGPAMAAEAAPGVSGVLNLNTASEEELMRLPGVGPSKAKAILELRTQLKGFKKVEDLMRVKGIGRKTFRKLMPLLKLDGATTLVETQRASHPRASKPGASNPQAKPAKE